MVFAKAQAETSCSTCSQSLRRLDVTRDGICSFLAMHEAAHAGVAVLLDGHCQLHPGRLHQRGHHGARPVRADGLSKPAESITRWPRVQDGSARPDGARQHGAARRPARHLAAAAPGQPAAGAALVRAGPRGSAGRAAVAARGRAGAPRRPPAAARRARRLRPADGQGAGRPRLAGGARALPVRAQVRRRHVRAAGPAAGRAGAGAARPLLSGLLRRPGPPEARGQVGRARLGPVRHVPAVRAGRRLRAVGRPGGVPGRQRSAPAPLQERGRVGGHLAGAAGRHAPPRPAVRYRVHVARLRQPLPGDAQAERRADAGEAADAGAARGSLRQGTSREEVVSLQLERAAVQVLRAHRRPVRALSRRRLRPASATPCDDGVSWWRGRAVTEGAAGAAAVLCCPPPPAPVRTDGRVVLWFRGMYD